MPSERRCRVCGCTDLDCSGCIARTGNPCLWVEENLCSACDEASCGLASYVVLTANEPTVFGDVFTEEALENMVKQYNERIQTHPVLSPLVFEKKEDRHAFDEMTEWVRRHRQADVIWRGPIFRR